MDYIETACLLFSGLLLILFDSLQRISRIKVTRKSRRGNIRCFAGRSPRIFRRGSCGWVEQWERRWCGKQLRQNFGLGGIMETHTSGGSRLSPERRVRRDNSKYLYICLPTYNYISSFLRPANLETSSKPCIGGRFDSVEMVNALQHRGQEPQHVFHTFAALSISAYVFPWYSKIGSQPAITHGLVSAWFNTGK